MSLKEKKVYIAGAGGMVGTAIKKNLTSKNYQNLLCPSSKELNLINQAEVQNFFSSEKPEIVIMSAAKVGGIAANNTYRAEFLYNNLMIEANVIEAARRQGVKKLIFLGSSCIYPKFAPQPIKEEDLLSGYLEFSNEPYAVAKIAGIKLCESYYRQYGCNFISVMPTNLFGENDNFDLENSHVIPALISKFHKAKTSRENQVVLWGTGKPRREFLYADDLAEAVVFLLENLDAEDLYRENISHLNVGSGEDIEIRELAYLIQKIIGFEGEIVYDPTKPDGTPRKLLDVSRIKKLGWQYRTTLEEGLIKTYDWFLGNSLMRKAI